MTYDKKSIRQVITVLIMMLMTSGPVLAQTDFEQDIPPYISERLTYQIGGRTTTLPMFSGSDQLLIDPSAELAWNYSACGDFNMIDDIGKTLENLDESIDRVINLLLTSLDALIATIPEYVFQRLNPGAYELLTNFRLILEDAFRLAIKRCNDIERDIQDGENPYYDLIKFAVANKWRTLSFDLGEDGIAAEISEEVDQYDGTDGVLWVDGEYRGGEGQEPINVIGDICRVGYNALGTDEGMIQFYFESEDVAVEWCNEVLGESVFTYDVGPSEQAGRGIYTLIAEKTDEVGEILFGLLGGDTHLSEEQIAEISSVRYLINNEVVANLNDIPVEEAKILITRMANDVATSRVIEQSLAVRRMILAGIREPHIKNASTIGRIVRERYIPELDDELNQLTFEMNVQRQLSVTPETSYQLRKRAGQYSGVKRVGKPTTPFFDSGLPSVDDPVQ